MDSECKASLFLLVNALPLHYCLMSGQILGQFWRIFKYFETNAFYQKVKHRINMLTNKVHDDPKFDQIEGSPEMTWNIIQGQFSMSISCAQSDSSTLAFGFAKELGKMVLDDMVDSW